MNRVVIKSERYKEAAELRDEITAMKLRDPYVFLEMKLKKAIQASEYVEAAKVSHPSPTPHYIHVPSFTLDGDA